MLVYEFLNWLEENKLEKDYDAYQSTLIQMQTTGELDRFLEYYYRDDKNYFYHPICEKIDRVFPMFTLKKWLKPIDKIDSVLVDNIGEFHTIPQVEEDKYIVYLKQKNLFYLKKQANNINISQVLFNGPTYCLEQIDDFSHLKLKFCMSDYFSYLVMCESRINELIMKSYSLRTKEENDKFPILSNILDWRNRTARRFDMKQNFLQHYWKMGIIVLVVFKFSEDDYRFPISLRSDYLAEYPGRYSLIPSGTFQPSSYGHKQEEFKISNVVFREFVEELFGVDELLEQKKDHTNCLYVGISALRTLLDSLDKKSFLSYTGFGIDTFAYKPELTCVLFIDDEDYIRNFKTSMVGSWESSSITQMPLFININDNRILEILNEGHIVPSAAMALIEGLRVLKTKHHLNSILFS